MKKAFWTLSLLTLAILGGPASSQEINWRPAADASSIVLGKPQGVLPAARPVGAGVSRGKLMDDPPIALPEIMPSPGLVGGFEDPGLEQASALTTLRGMLPLTSPLRGWVIADGSGRILMDDECCECMPCQRLYVAAEYLYWWTRGQRLPPLVATAPADVPEDIRGALGPSTRVLFGGNRTDPVGHSGARFTAGYWLDDCCQCAIEGNYFFLAQNHQRFEANSNQFPVLSRPFFNINTGAQDRQLTATPGTAPGDAFRLTGRIAVDLPSRLQGAELNFKHKCIEGCDFRLQVFAGARYLDLHEGVRIVEDGTSLQAVAGTNLFDPGTRFIVRDSFDTHNRFFGGQVGASAEWQRDRWFVEGRVKLGLGATHQEINIAGSQTFIAPGGAQSNFVGGLLAVPSNIGHFSRDRFSVVPEAGLKIGYQVNENVRVYVGYDFMYWTNVVRPGDQIDTVVNVNQIPNFNLNPVFNPPNSTNRPAVLFRTSDFWAQGVSAGVEIRY